ncbi:hypothetical protein ACO229_06895 [Promicromonospora sp. MS192]|uniref:hypothetical protein n=1 Tax=Promicromonospora sp. MS192 TaxID=3412684 RepID=UPI003C2D1719
MVLTPPAATRAATKDLAPAVITGLAGSFPLIARPAEPYGPLEDRVAALVDSLPASSEHAPATVAMLATKTLNQAALLASECQRHKEANTILRHHLSAYTTQDSLSVPAAVGMLEPVTDLARLHALVGQTDRAVVWLTRTMHALRTSTRVSVDRYELPLDRVEVHGEEPDGPRMLGWAGERLLADTVKILTRAGRWSDAVDLISRNGGPGARLTETRQAMITTHLVAGEPVTARHYLAGAQPTQAWEDEIASCLTVLAAEPGDRAQAVEAMLATFQRSTPAPGMVGYRTRYGIAVTRLAHATGHPYAVIARQVAAEVIEAGDGGAARDVLRAVGGCLSRTDITTLERSVTRSGLHAGALAGHHLSRLRVATQHALQLLRAALDHEHADRTTTGS